MKRAFLIGFIMTWVMAGSAQAQLTFGFVPNNNSLVRSEEEANLLCGYLQDRMDEKIAVRPFQTENALFRALDSKEADLAVVSNVFYYEHDGALQLISNFTRSEEETHNLLLISAKNGSVHSISDLKRGNRRLVMDEKSRSRWSFLMEALEDDPEKIFQKISVSSHFADNISGVINGTYDAACVESGLLDAVKHFDTGVMQNVVVLKTSRSFASDPVVSRKGLQPDLIVKVKNLLLGMGSDSDGQQILLGLKISRFVQPVSHISFYPAPVRWDQHQKPVKEETGITVAKETVQAPAGKEKVAADLKAPVPGPAQIGTTAKPDEPKPPVKKNEEAQARSSTLPQQAPPEKIVHEEPESKGQGERGKGADADKTGKAEEVKADLSKIEATGPVQGAPRKAYYGILSLGAAVLLLVLFLIILFLILRRKGAQETDLPEAKPSLKETKEREHDAPGSGGEGEPLSAGLKQGEDEKPPAPAPDSENAPSALVELRGELKTIRVPDLLQLMASCRNTGTLVIQSRHDEKCLYFREGKISSASCMDKDNKNKLGYLLIKLGMITEKERERALTLCAEDPTKRLGKALIGIGAVRKEDLRAALKVQATEIVYSLFLFPEGRFEFINKEPNIDPAEDLSLDVMNLLMEGARREDEWEKMRHAIPSMDIVFAFAKGGKEKLNGTELNNDQQLILSLINGKRTISEICARSTLVDFEVCNFLYRLTKLSILEKEGE